MAEIGRQCCHVASNNELHRQIISVLVDASARLRQASLLWKYDFKQRPSPKGVYRTELNWTELNAPSSRGVSSDRTVVAQLTVSQLELAVRFCSVQFGRFVHDFKNALQNALNNAYRKVFGMHAWQSVKELQFMCERLILDIYVRWRNCCIYIRYLDSGLDNSVLKMCYLFYCQSTEFVCMCHEFDIALDIVP